MRIVTIACTVVLVLGAVLWALVTFGSPTATATGSAFYAHRMANAVLADAASGPAPAVVWLGDSTLWFPGQYPALIQAHDLQPRGLNSTVVAFPGLDPYAFHSLARGAVALRPRVVVLVANLRIFARFSATTRTLDDLTALLPIEALPRMLTLPFNFRGLTVPGLLLTRVLRYDRAVDALFWIQGTRDEMQHAGAWAFLGPENPSGASDALRKLDVGWREIAKGYDRHITSHTPLVRFLAASVGAITAAGARALVVVSPIPSTALADVGHYDPRVFAGRIDVIRRAVENEGGTLVDLHDAIARSSFRDLNGHLTAAGDVRMRDLVWPALAHLLDDPAEPIGPSPG
jgi:hypothetical protein